MERLADPTLLCAVRSGDRAVSPLISSEWDQAGDRALGKADSGGESLKSHLHASHVVSVAWAALTNGHKPVARNKFILSVWRLEVCCEVHVCVSPQILSFNL